MTVATPEFDEDANAPCKDCHVVTTRFARRSQAFSNNGEYLYTLCEMCDRCRREKDYAETGVISSRLWSDLMLDHMDQRDNPTHPLLVSMKNLKGLASKFERVVWFDGGLKTFFNESKYAAFSMKDPASEFRVLMLATAGRALFTFTAPDGQSVTLITDESRNTPCMGIQSIDATEGMATDLITKGITLWAAGVRPEVDRSVGF